ncbi:hypothetical protein KKC63_00840 [Patescibacteria group bacterium]|nr:hypothetical protein [Patescibacteria group bacterium]MBU4023237.1 hypothetical protein [Patescibacteria group bacterium]
MLKKKKERKERISTDETRPLNEGGPQKVGEGGTRKGESGGPREVGEGGR